MWTSVCKIMPRGKTPISPSPLVTCRYPCAPDGDWNYLLCSVLWVDYNVGREVIDR